MEIFIKPLDTQFYRSGLPFDAGEDNEAVSFFPPYPRTLYGALRTKGIISSGGGFEKEDWDKSIYGDRNGPGSFYIKGPFIARASKSGGNPHIYLPFPLDVVMERDRKVLRHLVPRYSTNAGMGWDLSDIELMVMDQMGVETPLSGKEVKSLSGDYLLDFDFGRSYLYENDLTRYTERSLRDLLRKASDIFVREDRVGIARDEKTHTAIEGRLYRAMHTRMDDRGDVLYNGYGLLVVLEDYHNSFPASGLIQLGGEFRAAYYCKVDQGEASPWWERWKDEIVERISETGRFKAYLLTPAIFEKGSLPDVCRSENGSAFLELNGLNGESFRFRLLSLCTTRPRPVGGWDLANRRPKPMLQAVPEGSVYFFQYEEIDKWKEMEDKKRQEIARAVYERYNFSTWCSSKHGPGKEGFGIPLIGGW